MIGLPDGPKSFRIGLVVLIQYRLWQTPTQSPSHVAVAITLNTLAKASSLKTKSLLNIVEKSLPDLLKVVQQQFVGEVDTFMFLACQLVSGRLDYCNTVIAGLPANQPSRLLSILRTTARLIYSARPCDHVTSLLAAPLAVCFCSRTRAVLSTTVSNYVVCTFTMLYTKNI